MPLDLLLVAGWALFTLVILFVFACAPKRTLGAWLVFIPLLSFSLGGLNELICERYCKTHGGFATLGGMDDRGVYHLKNHAVDHVVASDVYWRMYRYEQFSEIFAVIGGASILVLFAGLLISEKRRENLIGTNEERRRMV